MEKKVFEQVKKHLIFAAAAEINEITEMKEDDILNNIGRIKALSYHISCLCEETSTYNEYK